MVSFTHFNGDLKRVAPLGIFLFQRDKPPLSKRISSSFKSVVGSKKDVTSPVSNGISRRGVPNEGCDDDLEMAYRAKKYNKAVVDDGSVNHDAGEKKSKMADAIDKASRVLFPLCFIGYNIFYWTYYKNE